MRLNSTIILLAFPIVITCASVGAAELRDLPRCASGIKIIHSELAQLRIHHPPRGRVDLEFTIDALGYVSDPIVTQSTAPRLDKEAMASIVLWRYEPPNSKCRHRAPITYEIKDAEDAQQSRGARAQCAIDSQRRSAVARGTAAALCGVKA